MRLFCRGARGIWIAGALAFLPALGYCETLKLPLAEDQIEKAFIAVLNDPYFERLTGLRILEQASFTFGNKKRYAGGTKAYTFHSNTVEKVTTEKKEESTSDYGDVKVKKTTTETEKKTTTTKGKHFIAYLPTVEFTEKRDKDGNVKIKVFCETGTFGQLPEKISWLGVLGALAGGAAKGFYMGSAGIKEWSSSETSWSPFHPGEYAKWIEHKWLVWRFQELAAGRDTLGQAFKAYDAGRYAEALPSMQELAGHFGFTKQKLPQENEYGDRFAYGGSMPEIFSSLGEIYRLHLKDCGQAEPYYRAAANIDFMPYLAESRGVMTAQRGLGICVAERARQVRAEIASADKEKDKKTLQERYENMGRRAASHLRSYLGFYGDADAPDKAEIMEIVRDVDPEIARRNQERAESEKRAAKEMEKHKEFKKEVKDLMEY